MNLAFSLQLVASPSKLNHAQAPMPERNRRTAMDEKVTRLGHRWLRMWATASLK